MNCFQNYPDELKQPALLLLDDHYLQAVNLLRAYLEHSPDDRDALYMLADGLCRLGHHQESLSFANKVLGHWPNDYAALSLVAECLDNLGNREQALVLIETWVAERAGSAIRVEAMMDIGFVYTYWRLQMDSHKYEEALQVALEHGPTDEDGTTDRFWISRIAETLIVLNRTKEVEALYSQGTVDLRIGLWEIGFLLVFNTKYEEALVYFRRVLGYAKLPGEFDYLLAYLECLHWAGHQQEVEALCLHWLSHVTARPVSRVRCLHVLLALSYERRGEREAAREHALLCCEERDVERCYRRLFLRELNFEETSDAAREVFAKLLL